MKQISSPLAGIAATVDWREANVTHLSAVVKEADRLGFGYFWVPEAWGLEGFSTVAHLLTITSSIRVGTGVVNVFSRSAALIGMACATLEQIAPGRFLLGLGVSGRELVEDFHGVKFDRPLKRLEEYVEVIRKTAAGEPVDFGGDTLELSRFRLFTEKVRRTELRILLAALGDVSLSLAGRISDGAILTLYPTSKLDHALSMVNRFVTNRETAGSKMVFAFYPLRVADCEDETRKAKTELARYVSFYVSSMGNFYARTLSDSGYAEEVERVREMHASGNRHEAATAVTDRMLNELCLIGSARKVADSLEQLSAKMCPVVALSVCSAHDVEKSVGDLRKVAREFEAETRSRC